MIYDVYGENDAGESYSEPVAAVCLYLYSILFTLYRRHEAALIIGRTKYHKKPVITSSANASYVRTTGGVEQIYF